MRTTQEIFEETRDEHLKDNCQSSNVIAIVAIEKAIQEYKEKLVESDDKFLRLYAEFENYKRRVQKEKEEIKLNTKVGMVNPILDMYNDVAIAIKNIKDESTREGVKLIAQKIENFLKSQGIETIQTETYDDELHEVISIIPTGKSEVIDVVSKGYMLNNKILRYPKIIVGK